MLLKEARINTLKIVGLATDFCVFATVKSARELGYDVEILRS